mmetsp:Transcript_31918/g.23605  ORF Transcript_31918/g.23605 Transcript_31918/m.23605 type:complete len:84 (-) Transcript_31918:65-316(-)
MTIIGSKVTFSSKDNNRRKSSIAREEKSSHEKAVEMSTLLNDNMSLLALNAYYVFEMSVRSAECNIEREDRMDRLAASSTSVE